jgi:hypothetical protein
LHLVEDNGKYRWQWRTHVEKVDDNKFPKRVIQKGPLEEEMLGDLKGWFDQ